MSAGKHFGALGLRAYGDPLRLLCNGLANILLMAGNRESKAYEVASQWKGSSETLADQNRLHEELIIADFFNIKVPRSLAYRGASVEDVTPQQCIALAARIMGPQEIRLMCNQGSNSYTLVCPTTAKIIQFRLRELNIPILDLARSIYGKLVPEVTFYPRFVLPTYISDFLPGNPHILQPFPAGQFPLARERATVTGLAAFVAKSTHFPQPLYACNPDSWTLTARDRLLRLRNNESLQEIDLRFYKKADSLLGKLHLLDKLPPVLTHHDFAQINILVADDGRVTGVIDFDAAGVEAFGMCIFGLFECFLGNMVDGVWSFYNQQAPGYPGQTVREVLEQTFWSTLWATMSKELGGRKEDIEEALQVAVDVGIVNRYFVEGMLDYVDLDKPVHRMSLEYARGILLGR